MPITLNWANQTQQNLSAIEIYRSERPIDQNEPGVPLASLPFDAVSYVDETVIENKNYYYAVVAVKNGNRTFSTQRCIPFLSKYGPNPATPVNRGEEWARYVGALTVGEFIDPVALRALLGDASAMVGAITGWYKFIHKGKVLYIPNVFVNVQPSKLNQWGVLFGTNIPEELPAWAETGVDHKRIIEFGDNEYIVRMIRLSNIPFTEQLKTQELTVDSEYRNTVARLTRAPIHATAAATARPRLGELTQYFATSGPHRSASTTVAAMSSTLNSHEQLTTASDVNITTLPAIFVLELLL